MRFEDFDKTIESRKENMIILYGSENKPLDNCIFKMFSYLRIRLGRDYKQFKRYFDSEDLEFAYNNLSIRNDKSLNELKYVLDDITITPQNAIMAISLHYNYVYNCDMMFIYIDNNPIDFSNLNPQKTLLVRADRYAKGLYKQLLASKKFKEGYWSEPRGFIAPEKKVDISNRYSIDIHLCQACNFGCKYCKYSVYKSSLITKEKTWKTISSKKIVNSLKNLNCMKEINICGGDPLLYTGISGLAAFAGKRRIPLSITANCYELDEEFIKNNIPFFRRIYLEIDSFNQDILFRIGQTTIKSKYAKKAKIVKICDWIREYNPRCKIIIQTVITKYNKDELFIKELVESGAQFDTLNIYSTQNIDNKVIKISEEEFVAYKRKTVDYHQNSKLFHLQLYADLRESDFILLANEDLYYGDKLLSHNAVNDLAKHVKNQICELEGQKVNLDEKTNQQ